MEVVTPKYQYKREDSHRKNNQAYYLWKSEDSEKIRVCKMFLKCTLDINDRPLETVLKNTDSTGNVVLQDRRGLHDKYHKVPDSILEKIRKHIKSIPAIPSHYCRQNSSKIYIDGSKSVAELHRDYVEEEVTNGRKYGNYQAYYKVFNEEFNIAFFQPKKDQCDECTMYNNSQYKTNEIEEKYESHIREKDLARIEKNDDIKNSKENTVVAIFDLQAVLSCPNGDTSSFYYVSKVAVYNLTFYNAKNKNVTCFVWNETEGSRGANEINTCVFKFLESLNDGNSDIDVVLYSDNCTGQNKNYSMMAMYVEAMKKLPNIKSITHKFLITGHTQNENDSVHSVIEGSIKRCLRAGPIYHPSQYITAISLARKKGTPYKIVELSHNDFFESKHFKNVFPTSLKIMELKMIRFIGKTTTVKDEVKKAELVMTAFLVEHNIPFRVMDHFSDLVGKCFHDSEIAKEFPCKRTKAAALTYNAIQPAIYDEMIGEVTSSPGYSIVIDESTDVASKKVLAIVIKYCFNFEVKTKLLKLKDLEGETALDLFEALVETLGY